MRLLKAKAHFLRSTTPPSFHHLVMIRTVLVTPTRVLIGPPSQEPSNSVTRRYHDRLDGIIRVQFADEEDRLHVSSQPYLSKTAHQLTGRSAKVAEYTKQADNLRPEVGIMARVRRALQHGLKIGGRRFMPVASSASQQKSVLLLKHKPAGQQTEVLCQIGITRFGSSTRK